MNEIEIIGKEAVEYELLDNLTKEEGWKVLLAHLEKVKSVVMEALLIEKDYNKIVTLQERYRAFSSVILTIQSAKSIKEKLFDDIQSIIEDEKIKAEFDL